MVDYTTPKSGGSGLGLVLAAALILAIVLYALYAGGTSTSDSDGSQAPAALEAVPDTTAPAVVPTE